MTTAGSSLFHHLWLQSRNLARRIPLHFPGARLAKDPEHIHQIRVSSRRLRVALALLDDLASQSDRPLLARYANAVRHLAKSLGLPRELDIALWFLSDSDSPLPSDMRSLCRPALFCILRSWMRAERGRFRRLLVPRQFDWPLHRLRDRPARRRDTISALRMVNRRLRQAEKRRRRVLLNVPSVRRLHDLRIALKKTRYAAELLLPFLNRTWNRRIKRLKSIQARLGRIHDDDVTVKLFRRACRRGRRERAISARQRGAVSAACRKIKADLIEQKEKLSHDIQDALS